MPNTVPMREHHPKTLQELKQLIAEGRISFPQQLEQVVRRMLEQPELVAFESTATVAKKCGVSQTTVMRLARHLGLGTFRNMKLLCKAYVRDRFTQSQRHRIADDR